MKGQQNLKWKQKIISFITEPGDMVLHIMLWLQGSLLILQSEKAKRKCLAGFDQICHSTIYSSCVKRSDREYVRNKTLSFCRPYTLPTPRKYLRQ